VYSRYSQDVALVAAAQASFNCTVFILIAGSIFFKGGFPERFWNPWGMFDHFGSHTWHHIFIVASVLAALKALPLLQGVDG
jgi:predicted membrane channel-forming protein YqfA (hemolysin III family)